MQNAIVIALILFIVIFVIYQYYPSFFYFLNRKEGFAGFTHYNISAKPFVSAAKTSKEKFTDMMGTMGNAHGSEPAGFTSFPGEVQENLTNSNPHNNPVRNGDPQSNKAAGNELKVQPPGQASSEGFADLSSYEGSCSGAACSAFQAEGPAAFGAAEAPAGCYPRDQLTPAELLPKDMNSIWAEQNPMGPGSLKGKNFLSAGALIGVNTVGQSLRNANLQIRSEPPNPQVPVSIFLQSTIGPDISHRSLEIN